MDSICQFTQIMQFFTKRRAESLMYLSLKYPISLPPAYVVPREGTVFTGVCLSTPRGTPFSCHNTSTGPMSFVEVPLWLVPGPFIGGYPSQVQLRGTQLGPSGQYPSQVQMGVPRPGMGYPSPQPRWMVPPVRDGIPHPGKGTSPARDRVPHWPVQDGGRGYLSQGWGTPSRERVPPQPGIGYPTGQFRMGEGGTPVRDGVPPMQWWHTPLG